MLAIEARNPGAQAQSRLGPDARVLEPSPPGVSEPRRFADNPTAELGSEHDGHLAAGARRALALEFFETAHDELSNA